MINKPMERTQLLAVSGLLRLPLFCTYFSVGLIRKLFTSQIINEWGEVNTQNAKDGCFFKTKHLRKASFSNISQDFVC